MGAITNGRDPQRNFVCVKADREFHVGLPVKVIDEVRQGGLIHFSILTTKEEGLWQQSLFKKIGEVE